MINFKAKLSLELVKNLRFTGIITGNHFPNAYIVINKNMDYRYVILNHAQDEKQAYEDVKKFRDTYPEKSVWILNYIH